MTRFDIPVPSAAAHAAALERLDALVKPVGALGRLEELAAWLCAASGQVPPPPITRPRVVVFAGDHGVSRLSAYPREVTAAMVRVFLAGKSGVNVLAREAGAGVRVLDIAVDADLSDVPEAVRRGRSGAGRGRSTSRTRWRRARRGGRSRRAARSPTPRSTTVRTS